MGIEEIRFQLGKEKSHYRKLPQEVKQKISIWNEEVKDNYKNMESFQVDIDFVIGRNGHSPQYFDSIISHMVAEHILGEWIFILSPDHDEPINMLWPLKKAEQHTGHWFYECGGIFNYPKQVTYWTKRFEKRQLQAVQNRRVSTKQGEFKSFRMPVLYDNQKKYKIFGKGVYFLLERIFQYEYNVGKKANIGFGEAKLKLQKYDNENVLWKANKLLRPIPVAFFKDKNIKIEGEIIYCPIHPSYYGRSSQQFKCYNIGSIIR